MFAKLITAKVMSEKIELSELVFRLPRNTGVFWVRTGGQIAVVQQVRVPEGGAARGLSPAGSAGGLMLNPSLQQTTAVIPVFRDIMALRRPPLLSWVARRRPSVCSTQPASV